MHTCDAAAVKLQSEGNSAVPELGPDPYKPSQHGSMEFVENHFWSVGVRLEYLESEKVENSALCVCVKSQLPYGEPSNWALPFPN